MSRLLIPSGAWILFVGLIPFISGAAEPPGSEAASKCEAQMKELGKALDRYQKEVGRLPDHLSDLVPKFIPDPAGLHCPADPTPGSPGRNFLRADPRSPVSYVYEFSSDESNGLGQPLGSFPRPDTGGSWGTCRHVSERQRYFFGDQVPVIRCFHHQPVDSSGEKVLNLTRSGRIYRSRTSWENHPDSFAAILDRTTADLDSGLEVFLKNWNMGRIEEYGYGKLDDPDYRPLALRFEKFGSRLESMAPLFPDDRRRDAYRLAARYLNAGGEHRRALEAIRESLRLALARGEYAPDRWRSHVEHDSLILAEAYRGLKQPAERMFLLLLLHAARPEIGFFKEQIGEIARQAGNAEAADLWQDKADPGRLLLGKAAPDFRLPSLAGDPVSLGRLLEGKKALLVNFWFVGCGACRVEMPHLARLHEELSGKGLEMVAVNNGDKPADVQKFIDERKLKFPVALAGEEDPIIGRYQVKLFPTTYLLSPDRKVVWRSVGFDESRIKELREALQKLDVK